MAPPTTDQTLALTEEEIDAIVSDNNRQDLFTHRQNAGIQFSNRDPTVRLAKKLRKFVCGDDDKPAIDMATIMARFSEMSAGIMKEVQSGMNEMKEELATSSERLERRILKVEKGEPSVQAAPSKVLIRDAASLLANLIRSSRECPVSGLPRVEKVIGEIKTCGAKYFCANSIDSRWVYKVLKIVSVSAECTVGTIEYETELPNSYLLRCRSTR